MTLFLAIAVLVMAAAIVLLFAMMGELTARLPRLGVGYRDPTVRPLPEVRIGARAAHWPSELLQFANQDDAACLVVLSTACATCEDVAQQMAEHLSGGSQVPTGIVVSCADRRTGEEFVRRHGLDGFPVYVDEEGEWVSREFGARTSPSGLVLRQGVVDAAYVFGDMAALEKAITISSSNGSEVVAHD
jgi:hypothetical protein